MTDPFKTNPYIFAAKKHDISKSQKFLDKVTKDSSVQDSRELGATTSFKQVFKHTKNNNNVQVEFETPSDNQISANLRPGHNKSQAGVKNTLWSKA